MPGRSQRRGVHRGANNGPGAGDNSDLLAHRVCVSSPGDAADCAGSDYSFFWFGPHTMATNLLLKSRKLVLITRIQDG